MSWDPKLIKASIALYEGAYPEARRLIEEYAIHESIPDEQGALVLWLSAQAQDDPEERLRRLRSLISEIADESPYAQMAKELIADEDEHEAKIRAARSAALVPGLKAWQVMVFALTAVAISVMLIASNSSSVSPDITVTPVPSVAPMTQAPPDNSHPLDPALHTGRYPQGILQILRFEDASKRVIDPDTGAGVNPVDGARFYGLQIGFECRSGVCDQPPEANLALQIDTDTHIAPRVDVVIAGDSTLAPVALGRVTTGWAVFEIPIISNVHALIVSARDNQAFDPITISLEEQP